MDWRVTTVARSSLVTRCALTWSSADLASGASCSISRPAPATDHLLRGRRPRPVGRLHAAQRGLLRRARFTGRCVQGRHDPRRPAPGQESATAGRGRLTRSGETTVLALRRVARHCERSRHPARRHRLGADRPRQVDDPRSERRRHSGARRLHPGAWRPRRMMFPSSWLSVALTARGGRRGAQPFRTVGARATGRGQRARGTSSQVCSYERTRCSTSSVRARAGQLLSVDALQRPHCGGFVRKPSMMGAIFSGLSSRTKCPASSTI